MEQNNLEHLKVVNNETNKENFNSYNADISCMASKAEQIDDDLVEAAMQNASNEFKPESEFYKKAQDYWSHIPPTVNGMLGGLGYISSLDIQGSTNFLRELRVPANKYALDCGAGIGRVSKHLLMPRFECVDMVEQDANFSKTAASYCAADAGSTRLGQVYNVGLQKFTPDAKKYDLIWSQWVLGHLTDEDLLAFFQRIQSGLKQGGYFVIKENVTSNKTVEIDETDSSVTRPLRLYEHTLRQAGLKIVKTTKQKNFPKGLFPVYMIACRVPK